MCQFQTIYFYQLTLECCLEKITQFCIVSGSGQIYDLFGSVTDELLIKLFWRLQQYL